jgi:hypothetical protein
MKREDQMASSTGLPRVQEHEPTPSPAGKELASLLRNTFEEALKQTRPCDRCAGKGYHHGFGEDGCDPDWCSVCGGSGFDGPSDDEAWAAVARAATESSRQSDATASPRAASETWLERWNRVTKGRNYAAGLAMLREPSPLGASPAERSALPGEAP